MRTKDWSGLGKGGRRGVGVLAFAVVGFAQARGAQSEAPTYYQDVKPLIDSHCTGCHTKEGIAPFPLTKYEHVASKAGALTSAVANGRMPPWPAYHGCADYEHDRSLEPEQVQTLMDWTLAGAPKGDPAREAEPLGEAGGGLSRIDVELPMEEPYTPKVHPDEYRCFVMDWPEDAGNYITGFGVRPGNRGIAHHVIAYLVDPEHADQVERLDAEDEGPGYECFGEPKVKQASWLGGWAPGMEGVDFPDGTGLEVQDGSKMILQMHYHIDPHHGALEGGKKPSDQSTMLFRTANEVEKPAQVIPWSDPIWIDRPETMSIPAGDPNVTHSMTGNLAAMLGGPVDIHAVFLHMHQLGRAGTLTIEREEGDRECLLNIPDWDFDWQLLYSLKKSRRVDEGDRVKITCRWDNSLGNQQFALGRRLKPRDVTWGDGSRDEMCLGLLYVTRAE